MADHDLRLISFETCPYVERSRIVLEEKDVDHDLTFIDLSDKPDWFLEISPRGKVPLLEVDDEPIFESYVINELIEELYPEPPMFPDHPVDRAQARSWIVYNNDVLMGNMATLWFSDDDETLEEAREHLNDAFDQIEQQLETRDEGPYFSGSNFGLVDAVYAPLFNRWEAAEELGHGDLLEEHGTLREYSEALLDRDSVQHVRADDLTESILSHSH